MAFKFNAILNFNSDRALRGMDRASKGFSRMQASARKMGQQLSNVGAGLRAAGLAAAPATAGFALAARSAANFEEQMSTVQSVILGTEDEMATLSAAAKEMGATTAFSARQAAEGQEFLARAGFNVKQIVTALPGVLDAAAASGIGLAEATDIVVGQIGAFGLAAKDATDVADTLALTTALTNTNFTQLGEGLKFAAPAARQLGLSIQETATAVGVLANAGVKGTLAGTALKNAMSKLARPSEKAVKFFGGKDGLNQALFEIGANGEKNLKPIEVIMANIQKVVADSDDTLEATGKAFEILGLRGATSFSAFSGAMGKETEVTEKNLAALRKGIERTGENIEVNVGDSIPSLVALRLQIAGASGTAKEMAAIRLDNLKGQFTLFMSAVEGVAIELGSLITGPLQRGVEDMTAFVSAGALAFQAIISGADISQDKIDEANKRLAKFGVTFQDIQDFASGFVEGLTEVKQAAFDTFQAISNFMKPILGDTGMTIKEFGKLAAKILAVAAIAAPVLATIGAAIFVLGPIISGIVSFFGLLGSVASFVFGAIQVIVGGILTVLGAVSLPVLAIVAAIAAVGAAIFIWRDEIFSAFKAVGSFLVETFQPVIDVFKFMGALAVTIFNDVIAPAASAFASFMMETVITPLGNFFGALWTGVKDMAISAFTSIVEFMTPVAKAIGNAFLGVGKFIFDALTFPLRAIFSGVKALITKIAGTTLGRKALSLAGLDSEQLNASLAALPGVDAFDRASGVQQESSGLAQQSTEGRTLAQAPSAEENAAAMAAAGLGGSGGASGTQNVNVNSKVVVEGRIRGKDLVLVQTKEQIAQTEMNGQQIDPGVKQKLMRNGQPMGGF